MGGVWPILPVGLVVEYEELGRYFCDELVLMVVVLAHWLVEVLPKVDKSPRVHGF